MTAKELAAHLKLNPAWVYEHAQELGAIRTGTGPKARIRFDLHTATQALKQHQRQPAPAPTTRPRRTPPHPTPYPTDAPLLQIRDPYPRVIRGCLPRNRSRGRLAVS
jgi:pyruvate/2-oxoglutarate dehydrogenase complex dihydrolipoamide acyltransferase (E2) component